MTTVANTPWQDTAAEIWKILERNSVQLERNSAQLERHNEQLERSRIEREKQAAEWKKRSAEQAAEWEKKLAEQVAERERKSAEWDKRWAEHLAEQAKRSAKLDKQFAETDKKINKFVGTFGQQWGKLVEALIKLDVVKLFQSQGIQVNMVSPRVKREVGSETMEIDLLLLNSDELVLVETKSTLKVEDVNDFLDDLADFKRIFTEYKSYRVYGAVAALDIPPGASKYAYRKGLFVLAITGQNLVRITNGDGFTPKDFG